METTPHPPPGSIRHAEHDHRAKLIFEQTVDPLGDTVREQEVPSCDGQRIDLWFVRHPLLGPLPRFLSLFERMLRGDTMVDLFSKTLSLWSFLCCHRKQCHWHFVLEQRADHRLRETEGSVKIRRRRPLVPMPMLWMTSRGYPRRVMKEHPFVRAPELGAGLYLSRSGFPLGIVVLSELAGGRETLLLRLMGGPAVRRQALKELRQVPDTDPDKRPLQRLLVSLLRTMRRDKQILTSEQEEFMTEAWAEFEKFEQDLIQKGIEQGVNRGQCESLALIYEDRLGPMPAPLREALMAISDAARLRALLPVFLHAAAADIASAVLGEFHHPSLA